MDPKVISNYVDAEREFLQQQGQTLQTNQQLCEMHTRTAGSLYRGIVLQSHEGGIVFQKEDGSTVAIPISLVEKFVSLPSGWGTPVVNEISGKTKAASVR